MFYLPVLPLQVKKWKVVEGHGCWVVVRIYLSESQISTDYADGADKRKPSVKSAAGVGIRDSDRFGISERYYFTSPPAPLLLRGEQRLLFFTPPGRRGAGGEVFMDNTWIAK